jgi:hypothetical protein
MPGPSSRPTAVRLSQGAHLFEEVPRRARSENPSLDDKSVFQI